MAGILIPLCDFIVETIWHILAFLAYGVWFPSFAMLIAFIFEGFYKYQKGSCADGKQLMPALALPRILFFPLWYIMLEAFAISGWIIWFYHGRWCDAFIPLGVWALTFVVLAFWPIFLFVLNSELLTFLLFLFASLWVVIVIGCTAVFTFDVVAVLIQAVFLVWILYNTVVFFVLWRDKRFRLPNPREIARDAYARIFAGDPTGQAALPNLLNPNAPAWVEAGQGQVPNPTQQPMTTGPDGIYSGGGAPPPSYGYAPAPYNNAFGGGPLDSSAPRYVGQEYTNPPSAGQENITNRNTPKWKLLNGE
jgi:tryptophan-rich sensory protein